MRVVAFDGARVLLTEDRWKHIVQRHPELEDKQALISNVISCPDEVYIDIGGAFHVLKKLHSGVSDYAVVIYSVKGKEGYIRTAYYTGSRRKSRRHRSFRRLKPS